VGTEGYSLDLGPIIIEGLSAGVRLDGEDLFYYGSLITRRFNGFDGLLATNLNRPNALVDAFNPVNTTFRVVEKLIPRFSGSSGMPSGRAVGVFYSGHEYDVQHQGAVGMFGALRLMFGPVGAYFGAGLIGLFWALFFRLSELWRHPDARLLLQMIGAMNVVAWVMSGNFDETASAFIIALAHLVFYAGLVVFMEAGLNRSWPRAPRRIPDGGAGNAAGPPFRSAS
jgi:hypothetical protein